MVGKGIQEPSLLAMHLVQDVQELIILSKGGLQIQHPHKRADGL
jgi:hypothetical protein